MNIRSALFCLLGGLCFTVPALGVGHFWLWWLSGIFSAAVLAPVLMFGPRHPAAQFGAIALPLVVIGLVCTMSEAVVFFPEMKAQMLTSLPGGIVLYLLEAAVLVALGKLLKLAASAELPVPHRTMAMGISMALLAGASYVLYYEIFGAIVFQFFTKQYYPHAVEQVMAMGNWFIAYQFGRGLLMTLAVTPIIYSLRLPRWQAALAVGALVRIVGGGASLLVPNPSMVATQRYMHIVEIMTQNVSLGITAVLLLRAREVHAAAIQAVPVT